MIHLWSHDIGDRPGGIQSYTAAVLEALRGLVSPVGIRVSLQRERQPVHPCLAGLKVRCYGNVPARIRTPLFALSSAAWAIRDRPRLIFSCHPNFARVGVAARAWAGAPFWTAAHGIDVWEDCPPAVVRALQRCDRILAVSEFTKRKMIEGHGVPATKISVLPNTYDAQRFSLGEIDPSVRAEFGLPPAARLLLSVGRLAEPKRLKGFDKVIEAMPAILREVPEAVYLLAGTGPDRSRLEEIAVACGVRQQIVFAGFVPDSRLAALYRSCDAMVMPSKKEGFGIVFLEALACGLPVIAGNVDASGEPLLNGELGVLIDPDNVAEIAHACSQLLLRAHPNEHLTDPAYLSAKVAERYGPAAFQKQLGQLLETYAPAG